MTIYAITDTKKGETGIAPTYLQTPEIIYSIVYDVNNKQQLRHPFIRLRREGSNETRLSLVDLLLDFRALLSPSCGAN